MIDTLKIFEELKRVFGEEGARTLTGVLTLIYQEVANTVTKEEFRERKEVVNELAEAQRETERQVKELAEAQRETERRVNELAEAQRETEKQVKELAEAQRRSEKRMDELERALRELAEAQKKTEEVLQALVRRVDAVEERLEGISNSVGYSLENTAYKALPAILKKEGIEVMGKLRRKYVGEYQVNIYGHGRKNGKRVLILGEVKVRPSKKEIRKFKKRAEKIKMIEKAEEALLLFVAHDFPPQVEEFLKTEGIRYFWSYEF